VVIERGKLEGLNAKSEASAMKRVLVAISGLLCLCSPGFSQSVQSEDNKAEKSAAGQVVSTAEITKIDVKKKVLQVRELPAVDARPRRNPGGTRGGGGGQGRRSGGYPGGGGRRRGGGYPGGGGGGYPAGRVANEVKEYKVFVTDATELKFAGVKIDFNDLHVSDRVMISGVPKGSKGDLDARTITRE
jgi:hypothetical protein